MYITEQYPKYTAVQFFPAPISFTKLYGRIHVVHTFRVGKRFVVCNRMMHAQTIIVAYYCVSGCAVTEMLYAILQPSVTDDVEDDDEDVELPEEVG